METSTEAPAWVRSAIWACGIAGAFGLRIFVATHRVGMFDADEGVTGLMARHVLEGEIPTFFWDQNYGGSLEAILTAGWFAIAGSSVLALRLVPLAFFVGAAYLIYRAGLLLGGKTGAIASGSIFLTWSGWLVWKSMKAHGYYGVLAITSAAVILLVLQLRRDRDWWRYLLLGVAIGVGWWSTPQIVLVAIPAVFWLVSTTKPWRQIPVIIGGAIVGAAPWLAWNARHGWVSLVDQPAHPATSYFDRLSGYWTDVLPTGLSLRIPFDGSWLITARFGLVVYGLFLAAFVWFCWRVIRRREARRSSLLVLIVVAYPFLYAISGFTWFTSEPRYLVPLLLVVSLIIGTAAARSPVTLTGVLVGLIFLSAAQLSVLDTRNVYAGDVAGKPLPVDISLLLEKLEDAGVQHVLANYWLAYRISFESDERIIATSTTHVRYPPHDAIVRSDPAAAYVFVRGASDETDFLSTTFQQGAFQEIDVGELVIYQPVL